MRYAALVAGGVAVLLALGGCAATGTPEGPAPEPSSSEATSAEPEPTGDPLVDAATDVARQIVGDQELSGSVTILGALGGDQLDQFLAAFEPFEVASGVAIEYEGTRDMASVLQTRVQGNNPPDLVSNPSIGQMHSLMASGDLVPLDEILDMAAVARDYDEGLLELGSRDGVLYGIMMTAALKGLIYHNPSTYDGPTDAETWADLEAWTLETAASGLAPWCLGVESGAASAWMATDWIEQFVLTTYGTEFSDSWAAGDLPWTSPEIRAAFEEFGKIATDPAMVNGGPTAVVSTDFVQGSLPLWADPARCALTMQADWLNTTVISQVPDVSYGSEIDFFLIPPVNPEHRGLTITAGEMLGAFDDRAEVRALLQYLATPESQALLTSSGSWLSSNRSVPESAYPTEARAKAAAILAAATGVRFDASDLMSQPISQAFRAGALTYITDPSRLDEVLDTIEQERLAGQ